MDEKEEGRQNNNNNNPGQGRFFSRFGIQNHSATGIRGNQTGCGFQCISQTLYLVGLLKDV